MNSKTLAVIGNVHFIQSDDRLIAAPFNIELCCGFFDISEVKKAAKKAKLPLAGWKQSEYGLHWVKD